MAYVLAAERLHADDTPVPVLAKGKTATTRAWVYVRRPVAVGVGKQAPDLDPAQRRSYFLVGIEATGQDPPAMTESEWTTCA